MQQHVALQDSLVASYLGPALEQDQVVADLGFAY